MEREMGNSSGTFFDATSVKIMAVQLPHIWMFAVALAVALTGCGGSQPEAAKPAEQTRSTPEARPVPAQDNRPKIVAFGDSLSAGFGLEAGQSFPDVVQQSINADGYPYQVVNMGVSGDTTTDGLERLPNVLALKPEVVIVEFGGNDGLRGLPVATTKANLAKITDALQKSGAKIVLAGMTLPRNYGPDYIRSFERMYVDVARQHKTALIPFLLEGVGGHADLMQPDGIHPTVEGAKIVAKTVVHYLEPVLSKNPPRK